MKFKILLYLLIVSRIFSESVHTHNHNHEKELGIAIGIVPGHDGEKNAVGLHLHYIKGIGEHNDFGVGVSLETVFDEHKHKSISIIGTYHFNNGITMGYAPGILFIKHDGHTDKEFTQHFELYYEFELGKFHIGPQFDIGFENHKTHYMFGIHLGIDIQ